ncbi:hypothetical protein [Rhodococcus sp. ACS1]|nr:hypothetical protein [Rhodococcus sp. ACS1]
MLVLLRFSHFRGLPKFFSDANRDMFGADAPYCEGFVAAQSLWATMVE